MKMNAKEIREDLRTMADEIEELAESIYWGVEDENDRNTEQALDDCEEIKTICEKLLDLIYDIEEEEEEE